MTQEQINRREWSDPMNGSRTGVLGLYSSRKESRLWVPRRGTSQGRTFNFGNPKAACWTLGLVVIPVWVAISIGGWVAG